MSKQGINVYLNAFVGSGLRTFACVKEAQAKPQPQSKQKPGDGKHRGKKR